MLLRTSTWGEFWSCSAFPSCKGKKTVAAHNFDEEQNKLVFFSADANEKPTKSAFKVDNPKISLSSTMTRAQKLYDLATQLFGSRQAAYVWLTAKKVGLGHKRQSMLCEPK
jgi:hypothetical protein